MTRFFRYSTVFLICAAALFLRLALNPLLGNGPGLLCFLFAVIFVAQYVGYWPGMAAIAVCALFSDYFFMPPRGMFSIPDLPRITQLLLFMGLGLTINQLVEMRRRGQKREAEILHRFHSIVEEVPTGILLTSDSGYITFANKAAASLYGLTPAHMEGRLFDDAAWGRRMSEDDADASRFEGLPVREALAHPGTTPQVRLKASRGGEHLQLIASATSLKTPDGESQEALVCISSLDQAASSTPEFGWSSGRSGVQAGVSGSGQLKKDHKTQIPIPILYLDHTAKMSGGEIALARLLDSLDTSQFRPLVLLAEEGPLVGCLRGMNIETHVIPLSETIRDIRKDTLGLGAARRAGALVPFLSYAIKVARFAKRHQVRVIHTNSLKSDLYGALAGRLARIPVVWHVRDHIDPSYLPAIAVQGFRLLARLLPSYVVTNSESTRERLFLSDARPSAVVPSGLDLRQSVVPDGLRSDEMLDEQPEHTRSWTGPVRIAIVGRLAPWKGQHIFLEAAARLRDAGCDISCLIIGSPLFGEEDYEADLRRLASSESLRSVVQFLGFRKDVAELLGQIDILVHASTSPEPFGQVVIEGMAEGLPVVATDGGGVREIITHGVNGLLVPMGDAEALTRALEELIRDPLKARRIGQAGFYHVRRHFTSAQSSRRVEKVYADLLAS